MSTEPAASAWLCERMQMQKRMREREGERGEANENMEKGETRENTQREGMVGSAVGETGSDQTVAGGKRLDNEGGT